MGVRIALATTAAAAVLMCGAAVQAKTLKVGDVAPDFVVTTYDGRKVTLDELRGQVIVLNYWATWCGPCRNELPQMDSYFRQHGKAGLQMFAVATEDSVPKKFLQPLASHLSFPLISRIKTHGYGLIGGAVPTNYVIDRNGVVRHAAAGAFDLDELKAELDPLLAQPAPPPQPAPAATTAAP